MNIFSEPLWVKYPDQMHNHQILEKYAEVLMLIRLHSHPLWDPQKVSAGHQIQDIWLANLDHVLMPDIGVRQWDAEL